MPVYAILSDDDPAPAELESAIKAAFPKEHYKLGSRVWFVSTKGLTPEKLSEKIGVPDKITGVIVFRLTGSYWGAAKATVWEWLRANFEKSDG